MSNYKVEIGPTGCARAIKKAALSGPAPLNGCMCQGGECESCNRVSKAWEAMREALRRMLDALDTIPCLAINEARAALKLANEVSNAID